MSPLPQRKKSPEEIAKLRESLGVPGASPESTSAERPTASEAAPPAPPSPPPSSRNPARKPFPATQEPTGQPTSPLPPAGSAPKRDVVTLDADKPVHIDPPEPDLTAPSASGPKPVRSLKKSEQGPITLHEPPPDSSLPIHRHTDEELQDIRRRQAIALQTEPPPPDPRMAKAHLALVLIGYLFALTAAPIIHFYQPAIALGLALTLIAAPVAAFIALRKPLSRHHAAFIAIVCVFSLIFAVLYYFPHLRNAT